VPYIHVSLAPLKIVAFLQLPVSELIFSATRVVLILALKINILREMTFNFTLGYSVKLHEHRQNRRLHIAAYLWPTASWNCLNSFMSGGRSSGLLLAHQQCVAGACSSVWGPARHAWSGWWLMSKGGTLTGIVRCGIGRSSAMKALSVCLQLASHVCEEVSRRRIQSKVPESDRDASSEDHDLVSS